MSISKCIRGAGGHGPKGGRGGGWQVKQTVDPRRVLHMSLEQTIMRAHKNPLSRQPAKRARKGEGGVVSLHGFVCAS